MKKNMLFLSCVVSATLGLLACDDGSQDSALKHPVLAAKKVLTPKRKADTSLGAFRVSANRLNRRTCPSRECGVIGQLYRDQATQVYEYKSDWARVSEYYDASCRDGETLYVIKGQKSCNSSNGIKDGSFAEWVAKEFLIPDPG